MALKKSTKALIRIAKRERTKAVKGMQKYYATKRLDGSTSRVSKSTARKMVANNLRTNRKAFGNQAARNAVFKSHGYSKYIK